MTAEPNDKLTPMMQQYLSIKEEHQDMVLFFRLGDFYEMFMEDAKEVSRLLNLTLTQRGGKPMCGIPYHAARNYIKRLLDEGKKIAICEQVELPQDGKTLAKREVVQVITPATVVDDDFLDSGSNSFLLALCLNGGYPVACYADISTGEFFLRRLDDADKDISIRTLIAQILPKEILVDEDEYYMDSSYQELISSSHAMVTKLPSWYFSITDGKNLLCEQAQTASLFGFGILDDEPSLRSAGALMRYLKDTAKSAMYQVKDYHLLNESQYLGIDESSRRNLEIITNLHDGTSHCTLFESVDRTRTAAGARLLKSWLSNPLRDLAAIDLRQQWVSSFFDDPTELSRVRDILTGTLDMVRLTTRVAMHRSQPHDLVAIKETAMAFFALVGDDLHRYGSILQPHVDDAQLQAVVQLAALVDSAIDCNCLGPFEEGRVILNGYDSQLDALRAVKDGGTNLLQEYLQRVKEQTGIPTIKLSYNKIIGHFLEVSKAQADKVPPTFARRQTLVNAERYTTDELLECETKMLRSASEAERRERALYDALVEQTLQCLQSLVAVGNFLAEIDVYQSMASVAKQRGYVRPVVDDSDVLLISGGRHPVVEAQLHVNEFVPNDLNIEQASGRFSLITGPNMAGKSTYLRQNALIVLLAQAGSFIPADSARIGVVDKLFCRVGASDNLARGESTFLVEMQEAAYIVRNATRRSLVIMDEIGRGTSTQDGMSIAYAVMRNLIELGPKTLFATHYHELTMLDTTGITLLTLSVTEKRNTVIFRRKIQQGVANSSYGLHVAKMAGMPASVLKEAALFQKRHFADYALGGGAQLELFLNEETQHAPLDDGSRDLLLSISEFDIDGCTPIQALMELGRLKTEAQKILQD